jgi:AbrB family looped-hinge helix DNA binding protein
MPATSRLTRKCQVTIPRDIRRALRIEPGALVHFALEDGRAVLRAAPESHTVSLRGMGRDVWARLGGADRFLRDERDSWS